MRRVTSALILLVVLAAPVQAQTYTSTDSAGVTHTTTPSNNMNSTTPSNSKMDMDNTHSSTTTDQNNMNHDNMSNGTSNTSSTLPKTASPLPLLSLGSLGALASSWWLSRRRRV